MYVAGKTTLDTLSILLTEFRAFSESQIARVTHLLRPFMPKLDNKNSHLLQVQSSPLFSVNWRCDSLELEKRMCFALPRCPDWSACWGWTQWSWENYHSLSDLQTVKNVKQENIKLVKDNLFYLSFFSECSKAWEEGNVTITASTIPISIPLQIMKMVTLTADLHVQWPGK